MTRRQTNKCGNNWKYSEECVPPLELSTKFREGFHNIQRRSLLLGLLALSHFGIDKETYYDEHLPKLSTVSFKGYNQTCCFNAHLA